MSFIMFGADFRGLQESETHKPFVLNSEIDGKRVYATKDLLVRHPTKEALWKLYVLFLLISRPLFLISLVRSVGRLDDQIILLNGEKTNPGPMGVFSC
jgi:hypothetical protein